jgi:hypothetical protein
MTPVGARALCYGFQHIRRRRAPYGVQWQLRMNFKQRLASRAKHGWEFQSGDHHGIVFVIVANERKPPVSPSPSEPPVTLWQRNELMVIRNGPTQAQSRECALHSMDRSRRTTVVAPERRRVGDDGHFFSLVRHFNTSP